MTTPSHEAMYAKRSADMAARIADENSRQDFPWSLPNVRVWQNVMCRCLDRRHAILRRYLQDRARRAQD